MNKITLLTNGNVWTVDQALPRASAVALRGGRIVAVGTDDEIRALVRASSDKEEIDLGGRTVIPGLIDAHVHFRNFALGLSEVNLVGCRSREEAVERVQARVNSNGNGDSNEWIIGRGWWQDEWEDMAFPTAADLDAVAPHKPVYLRHKSGHAAWVNTAALRIAGIDQSNDNTPDPEGGAIVRDENGHATGILFEDPAMELVSHEIPPATTAALADAMREAQEVCWAAGLVGVHDYDGVDSFQALQLLRQEGDLGLRVVKNIPCALLDHAVAIGLQSGFGDEWLRIGGIKIFADGALGPRTALMFDPYENEPNNRGIAVVEKEEMMAIADVASANGFSLTIHAIGDKAVHDVLDVYEVIADRPTRTPHRIEHVQHLHPADVARLGKMNIVASVQPTHATSDMFMVDQWLGAERGRWAYAFRDLQKTGALVVFGSDCPVESIEPLHGIHAAVTRRRPNGDPAPDGWYPSQRFTIEETIEAFTLAAAVTSGQQAVTGTIAAGKQADLTIFDQDIFTMPPEDLLSATIAGTVVGGEFKYRQF